MRFLLAHLPFTPHPQPSKPQRRSLLPRLTTLAPV